MRSRSAVVVEAGIPNPEKDAGSRAVVDLLSGLQDLGVDAHLATETKPDELAHSFVRSPDLVFFSRPSTFVRNYHRVASSSSKLLYFAHDLHFLRLQLGRQFRTSESQLSVSVMRLIEEQCFRNAHLSLLPTQEEVEVAREAFPDIAAHKMNYFSMSTVKSRSPESVSSDLVFIGSRNHAPNEDGITWFVQHVLPDVVAAIPGATLTIVGEWDSLFGGIANVKVLKGLSDDQLTRLLSKARIGIAPLRYGAGMKRKTLQYLACGTPTISTSFGLQGIEASRGNNPGALHAESREQWVDAILRLHQDSQLWQRLSRNGINYVAQAFDHSAYLRDLDSALARVLD